MEDGIIEQLISRLPPNQSYGEAYNKLVKAFKECQVDVLKDFIKMGIDPNITLFDGHSPLTLLVGTSISDRWQETAKLLLEHGSCANKRNPKGTPVLSLLVAAGEPELVLLALNKGANIEATGASNETALLTAVHYKQVPCLKVLLERGADPNTVSKDGNTAVMWAAGRSNGIGSPKCLTAVKTLLKYGADPNRSNNRGYSPLMAASLIRETETVRALIEAGAGLESEDFRGETALFKAVYSNCTESVKTIVKAGANVNARCKIKRIPLMVASTYPIVDVLLKGDSEVNAADNDGYTALHHFAAANKPQFLRLLLVSGAKLESQCTLGNTPLQIAIRSRASESIELLMSRGANITAKNNGCVTLFHELVIPWDFFKSIDVFRKVNTPALIQEIQNYLLPSSDVSTELAKKLLASGGLCDIRSTEGVTPLMLAALVGDEAMCQLFLEEGEADPHGQDEGGRCVLSYACRGGNMNVVKMILRRNVLINCPDEDGNLPIFFAAQYSHTAIVNELILDLAFYMSYSINGRS